MRLDAEVVDRPAEEGARLVALALLVDADDAVGRLEAGTDEEALHDFRVALRRLRTTLRAFRPWLQGSVRRRDERRVRRAARRTNAARDAEVQVTWLAEQRGRLDARQRIGLDWLVERLRARGGRGHAKTLERHRKLARRLGARLEVYEGHLDAEAEGGTFGGVVASVLRERLARFREQVTAISGPADEETAHRARIEGKRLRYLLEPLRGNPHADTRETVKRLKHLQDLLGGLHDAHVLAREVGQALVDAAVERARRLHAAIQDSGEEGATVRDDVLRRDPRAGLLAVDRAVRARRDQLHAEIAAEVEGGGLAAVAAEVEAIAAALERRAGGAVETERKYLLSAVPPAARDAPAEDISQGWLPGVRFRERIRRVRARGGERYYRALKQGTGLRRLEAEEETSREIFETLWPLTAGRRIDKRRTRLEDGGVPWLIDQFTDRDLVLAEVELPAGAQEAAMPDWLAAHVVREVTGDPEYLNENLAAAAGSARRAVVEAPAEAAPAAPVEGADGSGDGGGSERADHPTGLC
jgi:CHAD domain-containing protein/CYTH domain-containing protein